MDNSTPIGDATDSVQARVPTPSVIVKHDLITPAPTSGIDNQRISQVRQIPTGQVRGIQQFGTPNLFADSGNNYFGVAKDGVNQVLMGNQSTFGEGLFVTKNGIDVTTNKNPANFVFNSNQNTFKIIKSDIQPITSVVLAGSATDTSQYFTIAHNLGFIPAFQVYVPGPSYGGTFTPNFPANIYVGLENTLQIADSTSLITYYYYVGVDSENLYLARGAQNFDVVDRNTSVASFRYYILQETAS